MDLFIKGYKTPHKKSKAENGNQFLLACDKVILFFYYKFAVLQLTRYLRSSSALTLTA